MDEGLRRVKKIITIVEFRSQLGINSLIILFYVL